MLAEGSIDMINLAELAAFDKLPDFHDIGVESVANAYVKNLARLVGNLLHFKRFGKNSCRRLFAENMLARFEKINCNNRMQVIVSADGNCVKLGIVQKIVIIDNRFAAAVFLNAFFRSFGNNVAEIFDFSFLIFEIRRNMR